MDDRRRHCHEASLYKSHGRRKGTVYGYLLIAEVQIVVAWSVANVEVCLNTVIGSPPEKVAAFKTRFCRPHHVQLLYSMQTERRNWCVVIPLNVRTPSGLSIWVATTNLLS